MTLLAAVLYFLNNHSLLSLALLAAIAFVIGGLLRRRSGNTRWWSLGVVGLVLGSINVFAGSAVNALFLNAAGTVGSAVITASEQTGSQRNERFINAYRGVLTTASGDDVLFSFDSTSASVYPLSSSVAIPPMGERFVVKYVPGFERNVVIMAEQSEFGRRYAMTQAQQPVEQARRQWQASPANPEFREGYRQALRVFLLHHGEQAPNALVASYRRALSELESSAHSREDD